MSFEIFLIVLAGALLHAVWNLVVKAGSDKYLDAVGVTLGAGVLFLPFVWFLPLPAPASWPWLGASAIIHVGYFALVGASYAHTDMTRSYPVMRGVAPLFVTGLSVLFLGYTLPWLGFAGILVLCIGVVLMAGKGLRRDRGMLLALLNAVVIAVYTIIDGHGVRQTPSAFSYTGWLFLLTAPLQVLVALWLRGGTRFADNIRRRWSWFLAGGAASIGAYATALYGAQHAPIAMVAALREVSILFAVALAVVFLKEKFSINKVIAAVTIMFGVMLLRLA
jgi:drug/metabolite transporter (DMT)-like permease